MHSTLAERVVLVTGASRGIGRAVALALGYQGAKVFVGYHSNKEAADDVVREIEEFAGTAKAIQADVSDPIAVEAMFKTIKETGWGGIDILINNAGITDDALLIRMTDNQLNTVIDTNLKGALICSRVVVRDMMRKRWGRIINMSSIVGIQGNAGQTLYAAAKAGLIGLTRSLAKEVASRDITVNAIAPGWIETDMTAAVPEAMREEALKRIPLGRFGTPKDVAEVVEFLCTADAARYITGAVIPIDGGMTL